ncbi:MAG: EsaB/YukD family protein [Oscillospiraceae bacterium]|nr:EsaB/YukD family protein [Oscillospiraceae bacterium]
MVKLLVDVHTPGNGKTYEFQLDGDMPAERAAAQIIQAVRETENGAIELAPLTATLCDETARSRVPLDLTLRAAGVKSGHRLILV